MTVELFSALGVVAALAASFATAFFFGGRRWRSNYEAEHVRAERLQATLVEKDVAMEALQREREGMSERLARLDEERKEFGGTRVYEALAAHEVAAAGRMTELLKVIRDGFHEVSMSLGRRQHD